MTVTGTAQTRRGAPFDVRGGCATLRPAGNLCARRVGQRVRR